MALNSINTNIAAYSAQSNIGMASDMSASSIARLSSGDRIVRAADDVAAMSAGTSLRTNVTTLNMALINTSQGTSLLQVADGALSQITDILQRQKAIAVQAGAGSLTSSERSFLNQEFQNLTEEIDRLASETNFNGVTLLDGSLFEVTPLEQNTDEAAAAAGAVRFGYANAAAMDQETVILNGITIEFDTDATIDTGAAATTVLVDITGLTTTAEAVQAMANALNATDVGNLSEASYTAVNETIIIEQRTGGTQGQTYVIDATNSSTAASLIVDGRETVTAGVFVLQNADDDGMAVGKTIGKGTIGDSIIDTFNQTAAFAIINYSNATPADGDTVQFGDGAGGTVTLEFDTNGSVATSFLQIDISNATTRAEQLDELVNTINSYAGANNDDYVLAQVEARRDGDNVVITKKDVGSITDTDQATAITALATSTGNTTISGSTTFANGTTTGVNTSGVANADFIGNISGFSVNFTGSANQVDISIKVGDSTYAASGVNVSVDNQSTTLVDTTPSVRLIAENGDYFDIDLMGATNNISVSDQDDADKLAVRLDTALSGITFQQERDISSYDAAGDILTDNIVTGSLTGSSFSLTASDFSSVQIDDIRVSAPLDGTTDGIIEFDIDGVTYRSDGDIGSELGANSVTYFTSLENANDVLTFRNGNTAIEFDTDGKAANFEEALIGAFGIGEGGETIGFQVGVTTSDTLDISIGTVTTDALFDGQSLDVLTSENAAAASDQIDLAIDAVTSVRAEVGALQSRFGFASANIESSIQNQDAARGVLLDTDVAAESTSFATAQVQLQAGIAVLAQANQIPQNLLQLLG